MASKVVTGQNFEAEVLKSDLPVLVDLWAEWCGPCRMLSPIVEKLGERLAGKLVVAKLNVDENPEIANQYQVQAIPTLILFKEGKETKRLVGFQPLEELEKEILAAL